MSRNTMGLTVLTYLHPDWREPLTVCYFLITVQLDVTENNLWKKTMVNSVIGV